MVICGLSMASMELSKLRGSINTLKGHLTRTLDQVDKFLLHPVNEMMWDSTLSFQNEISKRHNLLEEAVLAASSISKEEFDVQGPGIMAYEDQVASTHTSVPKLLTSLNQVASESLLNASTATTAACWSVSILRTSAAPIFANARACTSGLCHLERRIRFLLHQVWNGISSTPSMTSALLEVHFIGILELHLHPGS